MKAEHLAAPLSPTVLDAIRDTPLAPFLDRSTEQVLAQIGVPALPQLPALAPLPGMPTLPALDPAALIKPVTDLFSGFGDGNLHANGSLDPRAVLQNVTQSISTALQLASAGMQLLQTMQSAGSRSAGQAAVQTATTATTISGQAAHMNAITAAAAGTVATGYIQMAAVATKFAITTAALIPTLGTLPGQAALLASAIEAGTEAMVITVHTKAQLGGQSVQMTQAGTPVPVRKPISPTLGGLGKVPKSLSSVPGLGTSAPSGAVSGKAASATAADSGEQIVRQVVQLVQPLLAAASQAGRAVPAPVPAKPAVEARPTVTDRVGDKSAYRVPAGQLIGAAPVAAAAVPLSGWHAEGVAVTGPGTAGGQATVAATPSTRFAGEVLPPLVPGMGALATAAARSRAVDGAADAMVDARHVDELVGGPPAQTTAPIIGAAPPSSTDNPYSL